MPIDVATGNLRLQYQDGVIQGKVELTWDRVYTGHLIARDGGILGAGWTCRYAATLTRQRDGFEFFTPAGALEVLEDRENIVESGRPVRKLGAFLELFKKGADYVVQSWGADEEEVWRYRFRQGGIGETMPLVGIEDVTGGGLDLVHEAGRLISVRQHLERRVVRLAYLPNGLLGRAYLEDLTGGQHLVARYEYDAAKRLCAVFDAAGSADRFEYDPKGRLIRELAKDGGVFSYRYDPAGRCVLKRALDGYDEKRLRFNGAARFTEVSDSYGHSRAYQHLPTGQVVLEIDSLGGQRRTVYDEHGRIASETAASGAETRYVYDDLGNRTAVTDASGGTTTYTYNTDHLLTSVTNPLGHTWRREYNTANQLLSFTDPLGHTWWIRYDERGQAREVKNPLGAVKRFEFEDGNLTAVSDWAGNVIRFKFDAFGRMTERDISGRCTTYRYDAIGNVIEVGGSQTTIRASYDAAGNLTSVTDGSGHSTKFRYGPCRRLLERIDRAGASVRYTWGTEPGWLEEITNEKGERYTFFRDAGGRVVRERAFDGAERHFRYDATGYVVDYTNANAETTTIVRDHMHRPVCLSLPSGQIEYSFDANGNLVSATNSDAKVTFERDPLGRIVREASGNQWVESRYNPLGHLLRTTTSLGHDASYAVDNNGAVTALTTHGNTVTKFVRDAHGQETVRQMPGARLEQRYDDMGRLVEQHVVPGRALRARTIGSATPPERDIIDRRYTYDRNSSITSILDRRWGRTDYLYDPAERLLEALREQGPNERFSYDVAGNVSAVHSDGPVQSDEELEYGPGNRLVRKGDRLYEYDAEGRRIKMVQDAESADPRTWTYEWDAQDRLKSLTRPDGQRWSYRYDALGRRVGKSSVDTNRAYLWDKDVIVHEHSGDKSLSTWMFDAKSFAPVATVQNGQLYSIVCDHLGTPKELINWTGEVALSMARAAWGKDIGSEGGEWQSVVCPIGFQGQWRDDESGLFYNRFRYFDPDTASFVSQDPLRLKGAINLYAYGVNPCNFIDPTGLCAAADLPPLKGKNEDEVRAILADHGFVQEHVGANAARNETWTHPDGSEVRIHPYGNQNEAPYRSANNAHVHKESPSGQQLTDRGIPSTNPADTHIGIPNPPDLPAVRGRPHGAGTM